MINELPTTVSIEFPLAKMLTQYKLKWSYVRKFKNKRKQNNKKVNKTTKFSTVKPQICEIKLGTPHTACISLHYRVVRSVEIGIMRFDIFTWNQENYP